MAEIVNLRRARKAKSKAESGAEATANAARFGRSKAERAREAATRDLAERALDGHKREDAPGDDG